MLKELAHSEKQRRRQLLKELKKYVLLQKRYKNARRLTRLRPGGWATALKNMSSSVDLSWDDHQPDMGSETFLSITWLVV